MKSKGIIQAIIDSAKSTPREVPLKYTYEQYEKDLEKIFSQAPKGKRLVQCMRCGDVVTEDCSCGYIGEVVKNLKEKQDV